MSHKDIEWAYTVTLPAPQKAVLLALAHCRNGKTGKCFPSQQEISVMTGLAARTVRASLAALAVPGGPVIREKTTKGGYRSNDEYSFNYEYRQEVPEVAAPPATGTTGQRHDMPEEAASPAKSGGMTFRAVEPTGIQPEVNRNELMPNGPEYLGKWLESHRDFTQFWSVWPRKDAKKDAEKAWESAIKRASPQQIYDAAAAYAAHPHRPARQYVPYAATWLRADRWNDPLPEAPEADRSKPTPTDRARQTAAAGQRVAGRLGNVTTLNPPKAIS